MHQKEQFMQEKMAQEGESASNNYEMKYYGFHACQTLWLERPEDIIRAYIEPSKIKAFAALLKWCAQNKKAYHVVDNEAISRVTHSTHHEGICLLVKERPPISFEEVLNKLQTMQETSTLVYLDGVEDPHNIGSIMRTAAYFGVQYIIGDMAKLPKMSPSAYRVAKGAGELVQLVPLRSPINAINALKSLGYELIATSQKEDCHNVHEFEFRDKTILVVGNEMKGISSEIENQADEVVNIRGSQKIESLNVSAATAICLSEIWRCNHTNPASLNDNN